MKTKIISSFFQIILVKWHKFFFIHWKFSTNWKNILFLPKNKKCINLHLNFLVFILLFLLISNQFIWQILFHCKTHFYHKNFECFSNHFFFFCFLWKTKWKQKVTKSEELNLKKELKKKKENTTKENKVKYRKIFSSET